MCAESITVSVGACRAVQCQQFEMALMLLEAGADPLYTCTGCESLPPLTAVMHAIPTGDQPITSLQTDLVQKVSSAACQHGACQLGKRMFPSLKARQGNVRLLLGPQFRFGAFCMAVLAVVVAGGQALSLLLCVVIMQVTVPWRRLG